MSEEFLEKKEINPLAELPPHDLETPPPHEIEKKPQDSLTPLPPHELEIRPENLPMIPEEKGENGSK